MTDNVEKVREILTHPEDIDPGDVGMPPDGDAPPPPDDPDGPCPAADACHFPLNDFGNGQRLGVYFGEDLMWVPRVGWFAWTGKVWKKDPDAIEVRRNAQRVAKLILEEIPRLALDPWDMEKLAEERALNDDRRSIEAIPAEERDEAQRDRLAEIERKAIRIGGLKRILASKKKEHRSFARTSGNTARIQALMTEGAIGLSQSFEDLDKAPLDVNTTSGVLRFSVSGGAGEDYSRVADVQLIPHDRAQMLTKMIEHDYDPKATCPQFDAFLERIQPSLALRQFLQRWFGLSMTGLTGEQKLAFLYGSGANGKSVLVDLMAAILSDYAATAKIESLTGRNRRSGGDATPDLVPLMGARMVRASEPEEGERLQEAKIKELTGGEPILVRALQEDFIEMLPIFKLTISGNHKPEIRGTDDGIWRRLLMVPFDERIPEKERDPTLGAKLLQEGPGILNWLVEGLLDYLEGGLREPEAVLEATQSYRDESDPIGTFLTDCTIVTGDATDIIRTSELVHSFNYWLLERGVSAWKDTTIAKQLSAKVRGWRHPKSRLGITKGKSSISQYEGLRFTDPFRRRFDDALKDQHGRPIAVAKGNDA